ncbi:MAG: hypothetical protein LBM02_09620 [Lachnospiraceae bacterium]|jgi:hypothetical protein|nr:hypothetical protein [Lachnospiraceae bacterium]
MDYRIAIDINQWNHVVDTAGSSIEALSKIGEIKFKKTNCKAINSVFDNVKKLDDLMESYKDEADIYLNKMKDVGNKIVTDDKNEANRFLNCWDKVKFK